MRTGMRAGAMQLWSLLLVIISPFCCPQVLEAAQKGDRLLRLSQVSIMVQLLTVHVSGSRRKARQRHAGTDKVRAGCPGHVRCALQYFCWEPWPRVQKCINSAGKHHAGGDGC